MRSQILVAALVALASWGCASKSTPQPAGSDGGAPAPREDSGVDAASADAATTEDAGLDGGGETTIDGCSVKRATSSKGCAEACGAQLTLPGGGSFCTIECARDADCVAPGSDLICPDTIGACVPRCTADAPCKAAGFLHCDLAKGGCDTL